MPGMQHTEDEEGTAGFNTPGKGVFGDMRCSPSAGRWSSVPRQRCPSRGVCCGADGTSPRPAGRCSWGPCPEDGAFPSSYERGCVTLALGGGLHPSAARHQDHRNHYSASSPRPIPPPQPPHARAHPAPTATPGPSGHRRYPARPELGPGAGGAALPMDAGQTRGAAQPQGGRCSWQPWGGIGKRHPRLYPRTVGPAVPNEPQ